MLTKYLENAGILPSFSSTAAGIAVLLAILYYLIRSKNLPPGPTGLPLLGIWPFLKNDVLHLQMEEMGKKYGDVFSFTITGHLFINLGSFKALREAHVTKSEYFPQRFTDFNLLLHTFKDGLAFADEEPWKVYRKYFIHSLKEHGMTSIKNHLTGPIYDTINSMVEVLNETKGKPISIIDFLTKECSSIVRRIMFNDDGISDEETEEFNKAYEVVLDGMAGTKLFLIGELARRVIFPLTPGFSDTLANHKTMEDVMFRVVNRRKSSYEEGQVRDIVDGYLKERNERRKRNDSTAKYFTDKALVSTLTQLFGDGILTVSFLIACFIQGLLEHPDEQNKIYQELVEVVGHDRQPNVEDKSNLPYTNAFILEVIRRADFFPLFPGLQCSRETTLRGYRIPKGAITSVNFWSINHDPLVYENPYEFNPSRFIVGPGKQRPEHPLMFGIGKRACIGEAFAMSQVFLFLTTIIKNFELTIPEGSNLTKSSILLMPGKMAVCVNPRTHE